MGSRVNVVHFSKQPNRILTVPLRSLQTKINEPILIIHGNDDSNPGTLTFQSEVFYEAVRGSGGTARLVLLPFEDHGYRAKESIEHVLWEQMEWFNKYVKNRKITEKAEGKP